MLIPIVGHESLRTRLSAVVARGTLPATLLLHGPPGGGKERLAIWIAELALCAQPNAAGEPCGDCQHCTYVRRGVHPDLHWYFPRPKPRDSGRKRDADDIREDFASAIEDRLHGKPPGVWPPTTLKESFFIDTIKALVQRAGMTPAMSRRKIIVVGDAHRLISQEGSDQASNAFLKLLEEPPANTTIILTTSYPASLLGTILSRVSRLRVPSLTPQDRAALSALGVPDDSDATARKSAAALLEAVGGGAAARYRLAMGAGSAGARGEFSETLAALTTMLHDRARAAAQRGDASAADGAARAVAIVERTKRLAHQNLNPQLLTAALLDELHPLVEQ